MTVKKRKKDTRVHAGMRFAEPLHSQVKMLAAQWQMGSVQKLITFVMEGVVAKAGGRPLELKPLNLREAGVKLGWTREQREIVGLILEIWASDSKEAKEFIRGGLEFIHEKLGLHDSRAKDSSGSDVESHPGIDKVLRGREGGTDA